MEFNKGPRDRDYWCCFVSVSKVNSDFADGETCDTQNPINYINFLRHVFLITRNPSHQLDVICNPQTTVGDSVRVGLYLVPERVRRSTVG